MADVVPVRPSALICINSTYLCWFLVESPLLHRNAWCAVSCEAYANINARHASHSGDFQRPVTLTSDLLSWNVTRRLLLFGERLRQFCFFLHLFVFQLGACPHGTDGRAQPLMRPIRTTTKQHCVGSSGVVAGGGGQFLAVAKLSENFFFLPESFCPKMQKKIAAEYTLHFGRI